MLDVHPPHHAATTWRDFFIHIASIVIGLLIALGLEQTVEHFHHRDQAHRLEETLVEESNRNSKIVEADIAVMDQVIATEERNKASLERAIATQGKQPFAFELFDPSPGWSPPTNAVYAAARDNGTLGLLPPSLASYLARLEFSTGTTIETSHQVFDDHYKVLALAKLHPDSHLSPDEQEQLLVAISNCQQAAEHSRMVLNKSLAVLRLQKQTPDEAIPER
jgi:hypothetical protein